jgi:hemolysin III
MEETAKKEKIRVGFYSTDEEIANAVTHGVGALLSIAALAVLIGLALIFGDGLTLFAAALYGASLVILYGMSTLYHAITHTKAKKVFRVCDRCSIFLLIAGTYSPFTLVALRGPLGFWLFGIIWGVAIVGIVLNTVNLRRFEIISVVLYLLMGWAVMIAIKTLYFTLPATGFWLLVSGGIVYTLGIAFFACKWKFAHSVWHLFVLCGSLLHFLSIIFYVLPK